MEAGAAEHVLREPFTRFYTAVSTSEEGDQVRAIDTLGSGRFVRKLIESAQAARNERTRTGWGWPTSATRRYSMPSTRRR